MLAALVLLAGPGGRIAWAEGVPTAHLSRLVTLITGQRVSVATTDGTSAVRVINSSQLHPRVPVRVAHVGGDDYVIPASASPYLSRYLDTSLFDVTRLAAAGITNRTPLRITYRPGAAPKLPGITITSSGNGVATGYVTTASAQQFGAALAAQAFTDQQAGWPSSSPLFGSVLGIAAIIPPLPTTTPDFPMVTLIVRVYSAAGTPIPFGFGFLMNQDDGRKYSQFVLVIRGLARVSLPLGHYMGVFDDTTFAPDGSITVRVMPVAGFRVSTADETLSVYARQATVAPSLTTPQPSALEELDVTINGADAKDFSEFSFGYSLSVGSRILLDPTAPPATGSLSQTTRWIRVDPGIPGGTYLYDATFIDPGVPKAQSHAVPMPGGTAQIHETYLADHLGALGATMRMVFAPGQDFAFAEGIPLSMPTHRTEYVVAPVGSVLDDVVLQNVEALWDPGWFEDPAEAAVAGSVRSETWLRNPFSMGVVEPTPANMFPTCLACRSDNRMTFVAFPQDGDPTHVGEPFGSPNGRPVAHFGVYLNGKLILSKADYLGSIFKVPTASGLYRVVNDLDRRLTDAVLSIHLHSEVTFRSAAGQGNPLPPDWSCPTGPPSQCTMLPILAEQIDLNASPVGTLPLGRTTFDLSAGHIDGAADPAITSAGVAVRRSGSVDWTALPVTSAGPGSYRVAFNAPAWMDGKTFDLRVTAADARGGALQQITTRAFMVSS